MERRSGNSGIEGGGETAAASLRESRLDGEIPSDAAPLQVLLIGPEGERLAIEIGPRAAALGWTVAVAESFLEAVLVSGNRQDPRGDVVSVAHPLILAGIAQEIEQLEPAVRSLRKVNPTATIILMCDAADEVNARRACSYGADDYAILPMTAPELDQLFERALRARSPQPFTDDAGFPTSDSSSAAGGPRAASPSQSLLHVVELQARDRDEPEAARIPILQQPRDPVILQIPQLPLVVQTVLMNDLLAGRANLAERTVATLESYIPWGGRLRFIPAGTDPAASTPPASDPAEAPTRRFTAPVVSAPSTFGELILELSTETAAPQSLLEQAATWLGSLLAIARRYEQLRSLAITDELSGAYNRRYFTKFVGGLLDRARTSRFRVSLLLFDIDDFKQYNDNFGHAAGDAIIRELAKLMRNCTRPHDLVARIGGDEFAVVFWDNEAPRQPNSEHPRDALAATQRFRKAVATHQWGTACNIQGMVSISGGLATFPWDADTLDMLMAKADEALLRAKASGKNVIMLHGSDTAEPNTPPTSPTPPQE